MLSGLLTLATGYNALKSSKNASDSVKAQEALTAAEIARNEKMMELYAEIGRAHV